MESVTPSTPDKVDLLIGDRVTCGRGSLTLSDTSFKIINFSFLCIFRL